MLELIPAGTGRAAGYTLDRSPVCHRADIETDNHSHSHSLNLRRQVQVILTCLLKFSQLKMSRQSGHKLFYIKTNSFFLPRDQTDQTMKRSMTTDDETSNQANPNQMKANSQKSNATVSEEIAELASALPCQGGKKKKERRKGTEGRYRCGSLSFGLVSL